MRRRLVLVTSALSAVLCVASADQWIHGTGRGWMFIRESANAPDGSIWRTEWSVGVDEISLARGRYRKGYLFPVRDDGRWHLVRWSPTYSAPVSRLPNEFLGFGWSGTLPDADQFGHAQAPMWFVVVASALGSLPFVLATRRRIYVACGWIVRLPERLRVRRWRRLGLCEGCGYNLTANVSGICPECGTRPKATLSA